MDSPEDPRWWRRPPKPTVIEGPPWWVILLIVLAGIVYTAVGLWCGFLLPPRLR